MFTFIGILLLAVAASATDFDPCEAGHGPAPVRLEVLGCAQQPCDFIQGQNIEALVTFRTNMDTDTLRATVRADALGIITDFPLPQPDGCKSLTNAECPLAQGETATYRLVMPILDIYPLISLRVEHTLTGDMGAIQSCFWIRGNVVRPSLA